MASAPLSVTRYYFTVYMLPAVVVTYLPIWLSEQGISSGEIGMINAVPMFVVLLTSVFVGRIADRAKDWKQTIVIGNSIAVLFCVILGLGNNFWTILLLWTLASVPAGLAGPVADAATMRLSQSRGFSFGTVRAWGTTGYMVMSVVSGVVIAWFGSAAFLWLIGGMAILRAVNSVLLPRMRGEDSLRSDSTGFMLTQQLRAALHPWILLPLIGGALLFSTHMVMNSFSSLIWKEQHISESTIGFLIAFGAISEALTMFIWQWFRVRFAARHLILLASLVAVLRWGLMAAAPPVWAMFILQGLQGITFTFGFLGCLYFLSDRTPESVSAEAQSLHGVMQQSASVVAVLAFGVAFSQFGVVAFLGSAALSCVVAGLVLLSLSWHGAGVEG